MVRDHRQPAVEFAEVQHSAHRPVAGEPTRREPERAQDHGVVPLHVTSKGR